MPLAPALRFRAWPGLAALAVLLTVLANAGFGRWVPGTLGATLLLFLGGFGLTRVLQATASRGEALAPLTGLTLLLRWLGPALLLTLALTYALLVPGLTTGQFTPGGLAAQLLFYSNAYTLYLEPFRGSVPFGTAGLWVLAVLVQVGLLLGVLLSLTLGRWPARRIATVLAVLCVLALAWRWHLATQGSPLHPDRIYLGTDTRFDSVLYGSLLALLLPAPAASGEPATGWRWTDTAALLAGLALLGLSLRLGQPLLRDTLRYAIQGLALVLLVGVAWRHAGWGPFRWLSQGPLATLGLWTPGLYLAHSVVLSILEAHWEPDLPAPVVLGVSLLVAVPYGAWVDRVLHPRLGLSRLS